MNRHVQELRILNFRGFRNTRLPLSDLTILVGRNGSGKTTVLDAMDFMREALTDTLPTALARRDGIAELRHRLASDAEFLTVAIVLGLERGKEGHLKDLIWVPGHQTETNVTTSRYLYGFSIAQDGTVAREVCLSDCIEFPGFIRNGRTVEWVAVEQPSARYNEERVDPERLLLPAVAMSAGRAVATHLSGAALGMWGIVFDSIVGLRTCEPRVDLIRQAVPIRADNWLERNAQNLANVLHVLEHQPAFKPRLEEIVRQLALITEGITGVHTTIDAGYRRIYLSQQFPDLSTPTPFRASSMSNGTLRALAILTALNQRSSFSMIAIEEIEDAIHPGAMALLMNAAERSTTCEDPPMRFRNEVIVTTHSTDVLNLPQAEGQRIRVVQAQRGESTIHLLDEGLLTGSGPSESLGDMLRINALWPGEEPLRVVGDPLELQP